MKTFHAKYLRLLTSGQETWIIFSRTADKGDVRTLLWWGGYTATKTSSSPLSSHEVRVES